MKTLLFKLSDLDAAEITEGEGDDVDMECWPSDFEPLGGNLFRVLHPIWFFLLGEPILTMDRA